MHEKFSVPTILVLGMVLILGSVSLVTRQSPVKVSVSKPLSKAAVVIDPKYDLYKDGQINNRDVFVVTTCITNIAYCSATNKIAADLNGDKKVDTNDVQTIREYILYTLHDPKSYFDLNVDGMVNNKDVYEVIFKLGTNDLYANLNYYRGGNTIVDASDVNDIREYIMQSLQDKKAYFDLNLDGVVNNKDIQLVTAKVGSSDPYTNIDRSSDGKISLSDVQMIGTYVFDLNGDGAVNKLDQDLLSNVVSGNTQCPVNKNCDLNGDGVINTVDSQVLKDYILAFVPDITIITITSPSAGQNIQLGSTPLINWKWNVGDRPMLNYAYLKKDGTTINQVFFQYPQEDNVTKTGSAGWKETSYINPGEWGYIPRPGSGYSLWVCSTTLGVSPSPIPGQESKCAAWAESGMFNITSTPLVFLNFPNGNNKLSRSSSITIKWQGSDITQATLVLLRKNSFGQYQAVRQISDPITQRSFDGSWTGVPFIAVPQADFGQFIYKIRVAGLTASGKTVSDESEIPFAIVQ